MYKSTQGQEKAYQSYDSALALFDTPITEEFVKTDYGMSHLLIGGQEGMPPVILLPGLFGDATMWYANMGALSAHYKVYAPDMPNYGGKSIPSERKIESLEDYKKWMMQLMAHYKMEKVVLVGVSYSSWLAVALANAMPEKINSIVLLDPSESFMPMNGGIAWKGFKAFMFFPSRKKQSRFLDWLGGGYTDARIAVWREHMLDVMQHGSTGMFDIPQHKVFKPEELTQVRMPVLVLAGSKPILYRDPDAFKAAALKALPHADVIIIQDSGHGLNMEKPDRVNSEIIRFLNSQMG